MPFIRLASWYNQSYTQSMKTAISVPDEVFQAADRTAKKLGVSRSELYSTAVYEYIERRRIEDVTSRLNDLYAAEDSELDEHIGQMQSKSIRKEDW